VTYDRHLTALLVIDPYNDFISEGGKVWDRLKAVAEANGCVPHMRQVLEAGRKARLRVVYALHRRYRPGDYETWTYIAPLPSQLAGIRPVHRAISWDLGQDGAGAEIRVPRRAVRIRQGPRSPARS
jgi:nicotinamidase-related amidase